MQRESIYRRYHPAVVPDCTMDGAKYWFVFNGNKLLVQNSNGKIAIPFVQSLKGLNITPARTVYLGAFDGCPCYCAEIILHDNLPDGMEAYDLRRLYGLIDEDIYLLAGKAVQIVSWDKSHRYCGACGTPTGDLQGERAKICPKCGLINYPRISPAVITAVLKDDKILLAHSKGFPSNFYSIVAGFVEPGETLEEAVKREIMEETSIKVKNIRYFSSQPWPFPNSLMIGFTAEYESGEICIDNVEIADAQWFDSKHLPELPSGISIARQIIDWYIGNQMKGK